MLLAVRLLPVGPTAPLPWGAPAMLRVGAWTRLSPCGGMATGRVRIEEEWRGGAGGKEFVRFRTGFDGAAASHAFTEIYIHI
eukprot:7144766-Pyramimonas_sp.AAC.1